MVAAPNVINLSPNIDPSIQQLFFAWTNAFQNGYVNQVPEFTQDCALELNGEGLTTTSYWMDDIYPPQLWAGSRVLRNLASHGQRFDHITYESSFTMDKSTALNDKAGVFAPKLELLGRKVAKFMDLALSRQIKCGQGNYVAAPGENAAEIAIYNANATGALAPGAQGYWDGVTFFSKVHPVSLADPTLGTQANLITSVSDLTPDTLRTAIQTGEALLGVDGIAMGLYMREVILMVPPALRFKAEKLATAEFFGDVDYAALSGNPGAAVTNWFRGRIKVIVNPYLSNKPGEWYIMDVSDGQKPFGVVRTDVEIAMMTDPSNPDVFFNNRWSFGARIFGGPMLANHLRIIKNTTASS